MVALSKTDAVPPEDVTFWQDELRDAGAGEVMALSAASGQGVPEALRALFAMIDARNASEAPVDDAPWRP